MEKKLNTKNKKYCFDVIKKLIIFIHVKTSISCF